MQVEDCGSESEGISFEEALIQEASMHLAKVKSLFKHLKREDLIDKVQEIKDELNLEVYKKIEDGLVCTN